MLRSLHALILRQGNVVRSQIARPETVARYLAHVSPLADYHVAYWLQSQPHRVTGEGFLTLYGAGAFAPSLPATASERQWS